LRYVGLKARLDWQGDGGKEELGLELGLGLKGWILWKLGKVAGKATDRLFCGEKNRNEHTLSNASTRPPRASKLL
jgi:hypothetical protein